MRRRTRAVKATDSHATDHYGELKRSDGSVAILGIVWRRLPRNGGRALFLMCPTCNVPRRHFYGWAWDISSGSSNRVRQISWRYRSWARLRYCSEGGYLRAGVMLRAFGNCQHPSYRTFAEFAAVFHRRRGVLRNGSGDGHGSGSLNRCNSRHPSVSSRLRRDGTVPQTSST
jgi:hypothetical protein